MNLLVGISCMLYGLLLHVSQAQLTVGSDGDANGNPLTPLVPHSVAASAEGAQLVIEKAGGGNAAAAAVGSGSGGGAGKKRTKTNPKLNKPNERRPQNGQAQKQKPLSQHQRSGNRAVNKQQRQGPKSRQQHGAVKTPNGSGISPSTCRYAKSAWSECDGKTNMRSRTLTLKKGESNCLPTRTMQKKCKKACRYEKGAWSECSAGQMTRQDKLKSTGGTTPSLLEANCEAVRSINKKCNPGAGNKNNNKQQSRNNKERKHKHKAGRRNTRQD